MPDVDVVVVGGGISGLAAARELCRRGLQVRVLEREPRCGGVIQTDRLGDCLVDTGPDTLLGHKPAALTLCRELGLDDDLVAPFSPRTTWLLKGGVLRGLPESSLLGVPTNWASMLGTRAFTWRGKLRMGIEAILPRSSRDTDESIASFIGRRFGREAVASLAAPLLAGIHRGDATRLSMRALFPTLLAAENRHGSVLRSLRRTPAGGRMGSMSLRGGLGQLVERLEQSLPPDVVVTGAAVRSVDGSGPFVITLGEYERISAAAVLFATPPPVTARLAEPLDVDLAALCGSIELAPSLSAALVYEKGAVGRALRGWGFVVAAGENRRLVSASWLSSKWPYRAPDHVVLIRAAFKPMAALSPNHPPDGTLIAWADDELRACLDIKAPPIAARVYRRLQAVPQLTVGHLDRMAAIDDRLCRLPGVFVSAAGFRGVGIADCVTDAQAVARVAADWIDRTRARTATARVAAVARHAIA